MKIAYFDCFWGISGDMILASLIDAGLDFSLFKEKIKSLGLPDFRIIKKKVKRGEISATQIEIIPEEKRNFSYSELKEIIKKANLSSEIKKKVLSTFSLLAKAEKKVHGIKGENFHFEQLGEIDTLVDIIGAYIALDLLEIEKVYFSRIRLGRGGLFKHGKTKLPLPGPAVLELLKGIPIKFVEEPYEFITPTGAVLIKKLICGNTENLPSFKILNIGYGAGKIKFGLHENFLRVMIGELENKIKLDKS